MKSRSEIVEQIHLRAQTAVRLYKKCEADLIEIFESADKFRVHIALGYSSLFNYATSALGLSEEVAYTFINVARKVREVPELKTKIREQKISVSKARRITAVLTKENQKHWLELAEQLPKRKLEKMVAAENPRAAVIEKTTYISSDIVQLQVAVSEKLILKIRRAQDVLSQKKRRPVSLEETMAAMTETFLAKHDPHELAQRQAAKGKLKPELCPGTVGALALGAEKIETPELSKVERNRGGSRPTHRSPISASIRHRLHIKFNSQCAHVSKNGERCGQKRFLDIHHVTPVAAGGGNDLDNLQLLCRSHHRYCHDQELEWA